MNGSSNLEEADQKPFTLCPVCLRKLSYYLGFEGEELHCYRELRNIFKFMNYNDPKGNFSREIEILDRVILRIESV